MVLAYFYGLLDSLLLLDMRSRPIRENSTDHFATH